MKQLSTLKQSQQGFGHIVLVLAIVVIAAIGFAGWRVMSMSKTTNAGEDKKASAEVSSEENARTAELAPYVIWDYMGGEKWGALSDAPACEDPLSIQAPMDVSKATNVLYPGQVRGGDFKPHGGIGIEGKADNKVDLLAPMDTYLYRGSRNIEQGETQYMFDFVSPCGVMVRIGHLLKLSPEFQAYADQLPMGPEGDSRTTKFATNTAIKAGTLIATEVGFANTKNVFFDFGVYDLRQTNEASKDPAFANEPLRKADKEQSYHSLCWFDLLPSADKTKVKSLPARGIEGKVSDYCK